ncbi:hypothetical protein [Streptomyces sp. NPDC056337]|uniref:hypothetical protein n=1 Tax=Streptomyces sp. NPDC056337 TaxID=3345787 RepID=UPI0035DA61FE
MWEYAQARARLRVDRLALVVLGAYVVLGLSLYYSAERPAAVIVAGAVLPGLSMVVASDRRHWVLAGRELVRARGRHPREWEEARRLWWERSHRGGFGRDQYPGPTAPASDEQELDPQLTFVHEVQWPRGRDGNPLEVARLPVGAAYLIVALGFLALFGTRSLLGNIDTHTGLGPDQAPGVIAAAVGLPGLVTAIVMVTPRVLRAWGAKVKDEGSGSADVIRAEKEGEAAIILAQAELRKADAEFLRAEKGLDPLPPRALSQAPDEPPALPPASSNGNNPSAGQPAGDTPAS